jgi:hypothetical protein
MEDPQEDYLAAVKQVLRYMAGMHEHGLLYTKHQEGRPQQVGYNDADMVGDIDTCKITSGIIFLLGGNPIVWQAAKQKVVAHRGG